MTLVTNKKMQEIFLGDSTYRIAPGYIPKKRENITLFYAMESMTNKAIMCLSCKDGHSFMHKGPKEDAKYGIGDFTRDTVTHDVFKAFKKKYYDSGIIVPAQAPCFKEHRDKELPPEDMWDIPLEDIKEGILALRNLFKEECLHPNEIDMFDRADALIDAEITKANSKAGSEHVNRLKQNAPLSGERTIF